MGNKVFILVPLEDLYIDESYQRPVQNHIKTLVQEWDEQKCDLLKVNYREDGNLYVWDGQHRVVAMRITLVAGYIGIMSSEKDDTIFMMELKECSKRIYGISQFIFYALGYAIRRVLVGTRSGKKGFLMKKEQSQQLTLAECFGIGVFE